jgi:hypothetical protein
MKKMSLLVLGSLLLLLSGLPSASTITLTGSCPSVVLPSGGGYLKFTLLNNGNGTAENLIVSPVFPGVSVGSSTYSIASLPPNTNYTFNVGINSTKLDGTFTGYFIVRYQQDLSTEFAIFPCYLSVGNSTTSTLSITGISSNGKRLYLILYNIGATPIAATLGVAAPPQFSISPQNVSVSVGSHSSIRQQFNITEPQTVGVFSIVGIASYIANNTHYSTLYSYPLSTGDTVNGVGIASTLTQNLPIIVVVIAILIIVFLIALSIVRKRKKSKKEDA